VFWTVSTFVFAAVVAFLTEMFSGDLVAGLLLLGSFYVLLVLLVLRLEILWSRLTVSETGIELRTPVRRIEIEWRRVARVDVRSIDSENGTMAGLVFAGAFLPGSTGAVGNALARIAFHSAQGAAPHSTVPAIHVVDREGRSRLTLVGVYDWLAANALAEGARHHQIPTG